MQTAVVLIMVFGLTGNMGAAVTQVSFETTAKCIIAKTDIEEQFKRSGRAGYIISSGCYSQGKIN